MALTVAIEKRLGGFRLDVHFSAQTGEAMALLGASGCGKSLTLKCIAGIERPDHGRIILDGVTFFDSEKRINLPPQKRRVGYLFQQCALFPHMTAAQNIAAGARHLPPSQRPARVAELLAALHLEGLEQLRPHQLSGGQQQRTALARILASEPRALLLDEPFSALDSYLKWQLEQELAHALRYFPGPVLWVSHDLGEVYRNCARVCVLDYGRSSPDTSVKALLAAPSTISAARISGCKNIVSVLPGPGVGTVSVPDWGLTLQTAVPWREGIKALGIRAERFCPAAGGEVNAFPCQVVRVTEDVGAAVVLLRPQNAAADAPLLRMELEKAIWAAFPRQEILLVAVDPVDLLLLE